MRVRNSVGLCLARKDSLPGSNTRRCCCSPMNLHSWTNMRKTDFIMNRRDFVARAGMGMGLLSAGALAQDSPSPLAARSSHFAPRAKRVVHFFLNGGPSHVDTFDPKPALTKYA